MGEERSGENIKWRKCGKGVNGRDNGEVACELKERNCGEQVMKTGKGRVAPHKLTGWIRLSQK